MNGQIIEVGEQLFNYLHASGKSTVLIEYDEEEYTIVVHADDRDWVYQTLIPSIKAELILHPVFVDKKFMHHGCVRGQAAPPFALRKHLGYEVLASGIEAAGMTWLPALLGTVVEACLKKKPFKVPLSEVVAGMEKKIRERS